MLVSLQFDNFLRRKKFKFFLLANWIFLPKTCWDKDTIRNDKLLSKKFILDKTLLLHICVQKLKDIFKYYWAKKISSLFFAKVEFMYEKCRFRTVCIKYQLLIRILDV